MSLDGMTFDDDEQIVLPPGPKPILPGRVQLEIRNNSKVPMDDTTLKVLLMFTGEEKSRAPVDIVAILQVSAGMMQEKKLDEVKRAVLFVISKLTPVDRLSIVVFSSSPTRLYPLRLVTPSCKTELENLINGLQARGGTNMEEGLRMGLDILEHRKFSRGRVGAIIFMSDGMQTHGDACNVEVGKVTVHTFGFGDEHDPKVLKALADHSQEGTYYNCRLGSLCLGFAQCLGGILSVVAQDLTLVTHLPNKKISNYKSQVRYPSTTRLGDLCIKECCEVLTEVHLPRVLRACGMDVIEISYTYKFDGEIFESNPWFVTVQRTVEVTAEQQQTLPDLRAEDICHRIDQRRMNFDEDDRMSFDDDEQIVLPRGPKPILPGRVQLEIRNNSKVPMEDTTVKMSFMFTGEEKSRAPVDIVAILQVSAGMMQEKKLDEVKRAVLFVISKLTPIDRLSIVVFSSSATRLYPLRQVTPSCKTELENLINGLQARGGTNMEEGLRMGLDILDQRKFIRGRVCAIMFMSDGMQTHGDACNVEVSKVTVHTFGFGDEHDPKVLKALADHSQGGTYYNCRLGNLCLGFAQCLGGILSVVAQDLTLVTHLPNKKISNYKSQVRYPSTTRLGDLCIKECCEVLTEVHLPRVLRACGMDVIEISYTYKFDGEIFESNPWFVTVLRTVEVTAEQQQTLPDLRAEDTCHRIDHTMMNFDEDDRMSFDKDARMSFDDDEQIVLPPGPKPIVPGRVKLVIRNNDKVPMDDNTQKVLLTFTGEENSRSPVDIVGVLDVSGSMADGQRLEELKKAMLFVVTKLSPVDRLSIVKYSTKAKRLCPLRLVTPSFKTELKNLINGLQAVGGTNMEKGLGMGLDILKQRKCSIGRVGAIIFMSDGMQTQGDACSVEVGDVTVHTFGFGDQHDPKVLKAVADHSRRGTYSDFRLGNLSLGFAQCLGGLLSVVAQDLTLVLHLPDEETCNYMSQVWRPSTTRLGDLCIKECRKVLMEVHLPRGLTNILKVSYTYMFDGKIQKFGPLPVAVQRTVEVAAEQQQTLPDVRAEDIRLRIVHIMKQATADADKGDMESAQDKLVRGIKSPTGFSKEEVGISSSKKKEDVAVLWAQLNGELKYDLRAQLEELLELMKSKEIYEWEGRAFAYSLLSSHDAQRPAGRGYNMEKFATPQMCDFLLEAAGLDIKS